MTIRIKRDERLNFAHCLKCGPLYGKSPADRARAHAASTGHRVAVERVVVRWYERAS